MIEVPSIRPLTIPKWILPVTIFVEFIIVFHFVALVNSTSSARNADRKERAVATQAQIAAQATTTQIAYEQTRESSFRATMTAMAPTSTPQPTLTPTPTATPKPGTIQSGEKDGLARVYIPAGKFAMGVSGGPMDGDNRPRHAVTLKAFWMSRTQVTNAMYAKCVQDGGCTLPIRKAINPHYYDPKYANHPAVYIVWSQADSYCKWSGGRLPTEAEWERAASGSGRIAFPWGSEEAEANQANVNNYHNGTVPVGSLPKGASPYGVLDMGSNVREWVADWYSPDYYRNSAADDPQGPKSGEKRVLRGASWFDPPEFSRTTHRVAHQPGSAGINRGFRCAYDTP